MSAIPHQLVSSSDIASFGYDPVAQTLEIAFHATGVYRYFSVPAELFETLRNAPSPGKFFLQNIKGKFAWEKDGR